MKKLKSNKPGGSTPKEKIMIEPEKDKKDVSSPGKSEPSTPREERKAQTPAPEKKKVEFSQLAKNLTPARKVALKMLCGWEDATMITEAEFNAAIKKHLKNKE